MRSDMVLDISFINLADFRSIKCSSQDKANKLIAQHFQKAISKKESGLLRATMSLHKKTGVSILKVEIVATRFCEKSRRANCCREDHLIR